MTTELVVSFCLCVPLISIPAAQADDAAIEAPENAAGMTSGATSESGVDAKSNELGSAGPGTTLAEGGPLAPVRLVALTQASAAAPRGDVSGESTSLVGREFPSLEQMIESNKGVSFLSPVGYSPEYWFSALIKAAIVLPLILLWIRSIHLAAIRTGDEQSSRWPVRLFVVGMVGIIAVIASPTWFLAVPALVLCNAWPVVSFVRSTNSEENPVQWSELLRTRPTAAYTTPEVRLRGAIAPSTVAFLSAEELGTTKADQLVTSIIATAIDNHATDLHINSSSRGVAIRQRVNGSLSLLMELPTATGRAVINVFKVLSEVDIANRRKSQDGSFRVSVGERRLSLRVSTQRTETGEKLSIRILDPASTFATFDSLGMDARTASKLQREIAATHGLILIVGATGAGKSTTACAALQSIDTSERQVVSIEDPIEYAIDDIDQIEINTRAGQSFEAALRSVLRLDADVIFIGEIRDEDTARIACRAAMTGQLVIATMHASDATSAVLRWMEMCGDEHQGVTALRAVVAQRLVRLACPCCKQSVEAYAGHAEGEVGSSSQVVASEMSACESCNGKGYSRRAGAFEMLKMNNALRDAYRHRAEMHEIESLLARQEFASLDVVGRSMLESGTIQPAEFDRVFGDN
jgi:type II secretory ATPase GspE/PulE/Tfp pilus assembly ATPase PilB-like protein